MFHARYLSVPALLCISIAACSSEREGLEPEIPPVFLAPEGGTDGAVACNLRCSRDLRSVVRDCDGAKVKECPVGQACAGNECAEACTATATSRGSIGCSFWAVPPDPFRIDLEGSCYAAVVANAWTEPAKIEAELGSEPLDISRSTYLVRRGPDGTPSYDKLAGSIPPGQLAVVFLAGRKARPEDSEEGNLFVPCPSDVVPAVVTDTSVHGTGLGKAFHVKTSLPTSAYSVFPYGGFRSFIPSATLLLPEPSLGTNYVAVTAWPAIEGDGAKLSRPFLQLVAAEGDTEVRVRPKTDIVNGVGVVGGRAGQVTKFQLTKGQVLQLSQVDDLLGSAIETSKPVALFGGNTCFVLPAGFNFCDSGHQQIPPIVQWGTRYAAVPYRSRLGKILGSNDRAPENVVYRIVGAVAETKLDYRPRKPLGAPEVIGAGEVVSISSAETFTVSSRAADRPFYMAIYMTGSTYVGASGDPDFVNVVATEQYLDDYRFFVDFTFPESTLTFVRRRERGVFAEVSLDCAGPVGGWRAIEGDPDTEYAWLDVTAGGAPLGACGYGPQHAKSDGPFTLTVWGWGRDSSYGFPAGTGSRPISTTVIPVR